MGWYLRAAGRNWLAGHVYRSFWKDFLKKSKKKYDFTKVRAGGCGPRTGQKGLRTAGSRPRAQPEPIPSSHSFSLYGICGKGLLSIVKNPVCTV